MANEILNIKEILNDYSVEIQEKITEAAQRIAKAGVNDLKKNSPKSVKNSKHKGRYAKGWKTNITKGKGFVKCVIHNSTDWQLTHLLEKEHSTNNGGKYVPKVKHIETVHDKCVEEFKTEVERIIKNGG